MLAVVVVLAVTVAALAGWIWSGSRSGVVAQQARRRVVVTLKTGDAFAGVLYSADRDAFVLVEAVALASGPNGTDNVAVDGEVLILRADVAYMQLP